jgi:hypothetical protein
VSDSQMTTDHEKIKRWAEEREGRPAAVRATHSNEDAGILRIQFSGQSEGDLEPISWEEFFEKFEESDLAFLYQDRTQDGQPSRFFKLVDRKAH